MKKFLILTILVFLFSFTVAASDSVRESVTYQNAGLLIITQPGENGRVTSSANISILGASDPDFPLYINGEEVKTTLNGFFTLYAELESGKNVFIFTNGENEETITVIQEPPEPYLPPVTIYFEVPIYGAVENDNISRFADFDDDLKMRTPLARGTIVKIIAERGEFYVIEDETCIFKKDVYMLDRAVPEITVTEGRTQKTDNGVSVLFNVSDNPLYSLELEGEKALLSLYANDQTDSWTGLYSFDDGYIKQIKKTASYELSIYSFTFEKPPVGYAVGFYDGVMEVEFRYAATSLSEAAVLLDAGHGGTDPGALGPPGEFGPMEKDFNLYVAGVARDYLEQLGVEVTFIREYDEYINIMERIAHFDRGNRFDISVCVHTNSMPLSSDFSSDDGPLMFYTLDLSEKAADDMIRLIASETGNHYRAPKRQNFAMARYTAAPSMLFEMGFMCNPEDYERLLETGYLDLMGEALGKSIELYLTQTAEISGIIHDFREIEEPEPNFETEPEEEPAVPAIGGQGEQEAELPPASGYDDFGRGVKIFIIIILFMFFGGAALFWKNKDSLNIK
ncbi:MAG: N-acetylmuramoyl-L-alanine amidase [Oscillospiraceae bacterium]|nr:N-acetylmuramoyl-L-alanine amidase [Oscillospiraceae bacterium]